MGRERKPVSIEGIQKVVFHKEDHEVPREQVIVQVSIMQKKQQIYPFNNPKHHAENSMLISVQTLTCAEVA